jgi:hypothetical protein
MTSCDRHTLTQTEINYRRTLLDQKFKWLRTPATEKESEIKIPRFAFLKISANAHFQSRTGQPKIQALQKKQILPTLKTSII